MQPSLPNPGSNFSLEDAHERGAIIFQTLGSCVPGLTFKAVRVIWPHPSSVEFWYGGDAIDGYELIEKLEGSLDYRKAAEVFESSEALQLPDAYFVEMKIKGLSGLWKEVILIAMNEELSWITEHLLSLNNRQLKQFRKANGPLMRGTRFNHTLLSQVTEIMQEKVVQADMGFSTFAELFKKSSAGKSLSLAELQQDLEVWIKKAKVRQKKLEREQERIRQKQERLLLPYRLDIEFVLKNLEQYANFDDFTPHQLQRNLERFLKEYILANHSLPNQTLYVFRWGVYIRQYQYRFAFTNKTRAIIRQGSKSEEKEITAVGSIDFKTIRKDLK